MLALFAALAGGAYAATKLPKNSVGAAQLKKGAVTPPKLSKSTVKKLRGATGPTGPRGDAGLAGPAGPSDAYAAGSTLIHLTESPEVVASITVPPGEYVLQAVSAVFSPNVGEAAGVACSLTGVDETLVTLPDVAGKTSSENVSLLGAARYSAESTVDFSCHTIFGAAQMGDARVVATKVGALHANLPFPNA